MTLGTAERGCLLFADITGYTKYIGGTELTHAQDVVADLIETIVGSVEPRFRLSKLEGDAAFCYAPEADVSPSMMMDTVEATYFDPVTSDRLRVVKKDVTGGDLELRFEKR